MQKSKHTFEGRKMVDATAPLTIRITPRDINNSKVRSPDDCAIAKACRRILHTEVKVHLSRTYVLDKEKGVWVRFKTPQRAARELIAYDRGGSFAPGDYTLSCISPNARLGVKRSRGGDKWIEGNATKNKKVLHSTVGIRQTAR